MKKLLKWLLPLVMVVTFAILYMEDGDCSLTGAIVMASVITGLLCFPIPLNWGKTGYLALGLVLCIVFTLFLLFEKKQSLTTALILSTPIAVVICVIQYLIQRAIQNGKGK